MAMRCTFEDDGGGHGAHGAGGRDDTAPHVPHEVEHARVRRELHLLHLAVRTHRLGHWRQANTTHASVSVSALRVRRVAFDSGVLTRYVPCSTRSASSSVVLARVSTRRMATSCPCSPLRPTCASLSCTYAGDRSASVTSGNEVEGKERGEAYASRHEAGAVHELHGVDGRQLERTHRLAGRDHLRAIARSRRQVVSTY